MSSLPCTWEVDTLHLKRMEKVVLNLNESLKKWQHFPTLTYKKQQT